MQGGERRGRLRTILPRPNTRGWLGRQRMGWVCEGQEGGGEEESGKHQKQCLVAL